MATLVLTAGIAVTGCASSSSPPARPAQLPAAARFLAHYVSADGRVVRRDQGGDTVSEGQGYALLLSVALGRQAAFERIWTWTERHLQQPSGLFASHWTGGRVVDADPATDADLQIGWALALAGRRFHRPTWTREATRIGRAIAAAEIGYDDAGTPVLAAGPWAVRHGAPTIVEPGYWTPPAEAALAALTGDKRLRDLAAGDVKHLSALTHGAATLPPDWAHVGGGAPIEPVPAPSGGAPVQAGSDGLRTLVWSACSAQARPLAARWWRLVQASADAAPLARDLSGQPTNPDVAALSAVAAAAAAYAAGRGAETTRLLRTAGQIDMKYPTYYGAAWVALGEVLLTTDLLTTC